MNTEHPIGLPERDFLTMDVALCAVRMMRAPTPGYRIMFRIKILNDSPTGVRLLGRKWILRDIRGITRVVDADKVFDQTPILAPGSVFSFGGYHDFPTPPAAIELRLFGTDQAGTPFISPPLRFPRQCFQLPHR